MNAGAKAAEEEHALRGPNDPDSRAPASNHSSPKLASIEVMEREFALGNYNLVRKCAREILASPEASADATLARFASEMLTRTSPDPWLVALIGLAFLFFGGITLFVYSAGR